MDRQTFIDRFAKDTGRIVRGERVYLLPIPVILEWLESIDLVDENGWDELLEVKRMDSCYAYLRNKLSRDGFRLPVAIEVNEKDEVFFFHNGNHRLAAAVELGYTEVPVIFANNDAILFDTTADVQPDDVVLLPPPEKVLQDA